MSASIGSSIRQNNLLSESEKSGVGDKRRGAEKDDLCRAMGALFLKHRVEKLQGHVDRLNHKGKDSSTAGKEGCSWRAGWKSNCAKRRESNAKEASSKSSIESIYMQENCGESSTTTTTMSSSPSGDRKSKDQASRIIIVDVSLMIYSLRTIHEWLKQGNCRIIVPMETLRTLDCLKKGENNLNLAARKAVRFLEEKSISTLVMMKSDQLIPGLIPQKQSESVNRAEWRSLASTVKERGRHNNDQGISLNEFQQLCHSHRETISCLFYFLRKYTLFPSSSINSSTNNNGGLSSPTISLALALPPPHFDSCEDFDGFFNSNMIKFIQRADGGKLLELARQMKLEENRLIVAPTAASWLTADASTRIAR